MPVEEGGKERNDPPRAIGRRQRHAQDAGELVGAARGVLGVVDAAKTSRARPSRVSPASVAES